MTLSVSLFLLPLPLRLFCVILIVTAASKVITCTSAADTRHNGARYGVTSFHAERGLCEQLFAVLGVWVNLLNTIFTRCCTRGATCGWGKIAHLKSQRPAAKSLVLFPPLPCNQTDLDIDARRLEILWPAWGLLHAALSAVGVIGKALRVERRLPPPSTRRKTLNRCCAVWSVCLLRCSMGQCLVCGSVLDFNGLVFSLNI